MLKLFEACSLDPHESAESFTCWLALVCTSFSSINQGTSRRSPVTPWGDTSLEYIQLGNCLASRTILLCLLCSALRGKFYLEQPGSSLLGWFPRMEMLTSTVRLWLGCWWGRHYGALTPTLGVFAFFLTSKRAGLQWIIKCPDHRFGHVIIHCDL